MTKLDINKFGIDDVLLKVQPYTSTASEINAYWRVISLCIKGGNLRLIIWYDSIAFIDFSLS